MRILYLIMPESKVSVVAVKVMVAKVGIKSSKYINHLQKLTRILLKYLEKSRFFYAI